MASKVDASEIGQDTSVSKKRRFDKRDWDYIAEMAIDELEKRKNERADREKYWEDIDRQICMEPNVAYKKLANGKMDAGRIWMSEIELPLQAQALEVIGADIRGLRFPDTGLFFRAHAQLTDEYLQRVDFQSLILGDETEVPTKFSQDNVDKLVEGFLANQFNQTDFIQRVRRIDAEALKYGMGIGRGVIENKSVWIDEARGVFKENVPLPVLAPVSIKNLYLDTPKASMHSAQVLGPMHIAVDHIKFENLAMAASKGSSDPYDPDGGWMVGNMKELVRDDRGFVKLLELEGDIVIPRKTTSSVVIHGAIVTVALGGKDNGGNATRAVIRCRFRKYPFSSYILFPYQYESADDTYPTSPLMKGRPVQELASSAVNRMLDSAMLKIAPPVGYDKSDTYFTQHGGPVIQPYAQWGNNDPAALKVWTELGGDPATMAAAATQAINLYAELTGVLPGRVGAQTISHTTAYAKGAEIQRGAARTVNYVNATGQGPMVRWLDMAYQMGRDTMKGKAQFHIASYGGFVEVAKDQLPEKAVFEWLGSGGPTDENQKMQNKVNSLLLAAKLDAVNVQLGRPPRINMDNAIDSVLREGGWIDLDAIVNSQAAPAQAAPGAAVAAIQNFVAQQPQ